MKTAQSPVNAEEHRTLLSRFPSGVAVATAVDPGGRPHGMTASAICSVSLEPPLLLISVERSADFHAVLHQADRFALSILAHDQETISRRFAAELDNRFEGVRYIVGPDGVPLIEGAVAHILCQVAGRHDAGDHTVFFGQVMGGKVFDRLPLLHFRGGYGTLGEPAGRDGGTDLSS